MWEEFDRTVIDGLINLVKFDRILKKENRLRKINNIKNKVFIPLIDENDYPTFDDKINFAKNYNL